MIFDTINNIDTYKGLSPDIYAGLEFLQQVSPDIAIDTYQINPEGEKRGGRLGDGSKMARR